MVQIVIVHGRSQHFKISDTLEREWQDAIVHGLERARMKDAGRIAPALAFYGDIWRGDSDEDVDALVKLEQSVVRSQGRRLEITAETPWAKFVGWISDMAPGAGRAFIKYVMDDVHDYLTHDGIANEVLEKVTSAVGTSEGPLVLIGYSLGSVVGYEWIRSHHITRSIAFVSIGSPLGHEPVRDLLQKALLRRGSGNTKELIYPPNLAYWYNIRNKEDVATGDRPIASYFLSEDHREVMDRVSEGKPLKLSPEGFTAPHDGFLYASSVTTGVCLRVLLEELKSLS